MDIGRYHEAKAKNHRKEIQAKRENSFNDLQMSDSFDTPSNQTDESVAFETCEKDLLHTRGEVFVTDESTNKNRNDSMAEASNSPGKMNCESSSNSSKKVRTSKTPSHLEIVDSSVTKDLDEDPNFGFDDDEFQKGLSLKQISQERKRQRLLNLEASRRSSESEIRPRKTDGGQNSDSDKVEEPKVSSTVISSEENDLSAHERSKPMKREKDSLLLHQCPSSRPIKIIEDFASLRNRNDRMAHFLNKEGIIPSNLQKGMKCIYFFEDLFVECVL